MTSGWHIINTIHVNENWLGYDASRKTVTKRVMNFYLYDKGLFRENCVPLDILIIPEQFMYFEEFSYPQKIFQYLLL